MWKDSSCEERIRQVMSREPNLPNLYVYGDLAYSCTYGTICPFEDPRGRHYLSNEKKDLNRHLVHVRITAENSFGLAQQTWTYIAFGKALKSGW